MSDDTCGCGGRTDRERDSNRAIDSSSANEPIPASDRWLDGPSATDATLPADVRAAMGRFLGEPVETLSDVVAVLPGESDGSVGVSDLCHADEPTAHRGAVGDETYHFRCFYDAVVLAELTESPVAVHTEAPDGTSIEARATGAGGLTVTPPDAVMSFGIERDAGSPSTVPTPEAAYAAICPYVKAFSDRSAYEEWAASAPAATVGMPLSDATEVATLIAE